MAVGHKVSTGFLLSLWFRCAPKSNGATHFRNVLSYCLGKESLLKSEILTTKWGMFSLKKFERTSPFISGRRY